MNATKFLRNVAGLSFGLLAHTCIASVPSLPVDQGALAVQKPAVEWPETATVQELLRLDTQSALKRAIARLGVSPAGVPDRNRATSKDPSLAHVRPADRMRLKAIYGVGKRLAADVEINGELYRYRRPGALRGGAAARNSYLLVSIDGSCVQMKKAGAARTVCLSPLHNRGRS
jgi:hypothetical protein